MICSGGMNAGVPWMSPVIVRAAQAGRLVDACQPEIGQLERPHVRRGGEISRFGGLISR